MPRISNAGGASDLHNIAAKSEEFDSFMTRVDEVSAVVAGLRSRDPAEVERASARADLVLQGRVAEGAVDETTDCVVTSENMRCVNPRPSADPRLAENEAFKRQVETDAEERAHNKMKAMAESEVWKKKAIQSFRQEKYQDALEEYTKALRFVKDSCLLYTSRAQTYLKLERPDDALKDLEWALRVDDTSLRAWIHKGKAHRQLQQLQEAADSFNQALQHHPDQEAVIHVYIQDLKRHIAMMRSNKPEQDLPDEPAQT